MKKIITLFLLFSLTGKIFAQKNEVQQPIQNFEKLWLEFDLRYANFALKNVDWKEIYKQYRPLVNEKTTNGELFEISCSMLQELNDGHVTIEPNFEEDTDIECGPPYDFKLELEFDTDERERQFVEVMNTTFLKNDFSKAIECEVYKETTFLYRTSNTLAYLMLDEMTEVLTFGKFKRAVDTAVKAFQDKKGVIIDLRFNEGGWDYNAYNLASRFTPKGLILTHLERTKIKGKAEYTKMKVKSVRSKGKYQFTKPIVILTSDYTASAAEVFVLLMKDLPNVTIIGDNTEGIFSDMLEFKLPNKWQVSLSNQQFFSKDKVNYEGKGIAPKIRVVNSRADIENQNDPVIEEAIRYLNDN